MPATNQTELGWKKLTQDIETIAIKESYNTDVKITSCVAVPIVTSAMFATMDDETEAQNENQVGEWDVYTHGRHGNPTRDSLEKYLAKIEGGKSALTFSSGIAAVNAIFQTILSAGAHVIAMKTLYSGTILLLKDYGRFGVSVDFVEDFHRTSQEILGLLTPQTKMIWLESPVNPTLDLVDIEEIIKAVKAKSPDTIIVVDNTFLTPIFQRPLDFGADLTLTSCSKYFGGHADIVMGSIGTNSEELYKRLRRTQEATGAIPSPMDCYMLIRSLKTLPIRMKQHSETAYKVAQFLETHPKVEKVVHPGLPSHPQHKLALKQQFGHSGVVGIYLKGGLKESNAFLKAIKVILLAPSLGADVSVANLPSKRSHSDLPPDTLKKLGITDNYIRFSVGLESADGLIADLKQALSVI